MYERSKEDAAYRRERARIRREEMEEERQRRQEEKRIRQEEIENEKILRMDKKKYGVMLDTSLTERGREEKGRDETPTNSVTPVSHHLPLSTPN